MIDQQPTQDGNRLKETGGLTFRGTQGESDYPLLLDINRSSRLADKDNLAVSLEDIARTVAQLEGLNPARDVLIAWQDEAPYAIGYSRLGWYSSRQDIRLYYQVSFLRQEFRGRGFWPAMVRQNECRLREIAEEHPL